MNITGIIAEYNPFHNGHKYQIEQARQLTDADYIIIIMSGNFTQRGNPALIDKYSRTQMALSCGADLILELPSYYACGSAEYFARGAISLLNSLGVVNSICFGSENGNIDQLIQIADALQFETKDFSSILQAQLKKGLTFPQARTIALEQTLEDSTDFASILSNPNNLLGIEYLRAIHFFKSNIKPHTIKRLGAHYSTTSLVSHNSSAMAIRTSLKESQNYSLIKNQMPSLCYDILKSKSALSNLIQPDDISNLLHYKLLLDFALGYASYVDISVNLSSRIKNNLPNFISFSDFCSLLKTKELTYSRISRCLIHILLNIKKDNLYTYTNNGYNFYARILGFHSKSTLLLKEIKKKSSIPLLSKLADAKKIISPIGYQLLEEDIRISHIYNSLTDKKLITPICNEFQQSPIKL